ncbi:MAG: hypothetical protein QM808_00690 [Steroidobacteraceae bacterium]
MRIRSEWLAASIILLCFAVSLLLWYRIDTRPPAWDETVHLQLAADYRDFILHDTPIRTRWTAIYPPLYHLTLVPAMSLGEPSMLKAVLTHTAYLALLLWALTAFARGCGASPWLGLVAGACFIAMPTVLWVERRPLINFALTAWIVAGMEWLRRTDGFRRRGAVVLWGLWSGLGMLMKPFYPLWFIGPVLLCLWQGRTASLQEGKAPSLPWKNLFLAAGITAVTALPYYGWQGPLFFSNAAQLVSEQGATEGDPGFGSLAGWWYYLHGIVLQAGWVLSALMAIGLAWELIQRRLERYSKKLLPHGSGWLIAWIVSGYVLFTFNHNKDLRYTLPLLPPLIMLSLWSVQQWLAQLRIALTALGVVLALFAWNALHVDLPVAEDWQQRRIGDLLVQQRDPQQPFLLTAMISNHAFFFSRNLIWSMRTRGLSINGSSADNAEANFSEYVILKGGNLGPGEDAVTRDALLASGRAFNDYYPEIARLPLPDGSEASIRQRDADHVFRIDNLTQQELEQRLHDSLGTLIEGPLNVAITGTPDQWQRGRIASVTISGGPWRIRGMPIAAGEIVLREARFNLYQLWDHQQLGLVGFETLLPRITLHADDLIAHLQKKARHLHNVALRFDDGHLLVSATYSGIPVTVDLALTMQTQPHVLIAQLKQLRIAGIPLPGWLLGKSSRQRVSLDPVPAFPGRIDIASLQMTGDALTILPNEP